VPQKARTVLAVFSETDWIDAGDLPQELWTPFVSQQRHDKRSGRLSNSLDSDHGLSLRDTCEVFGEAAKGTGPLATLLAFMHTDKQASRRLRPWLGLSSSFIRLPFIAVSDRVAENLPWRTQRGAIVSSNEELSQMSDDPKIIKKSEALRTRVEGLFNQIESKSLFPHQEEFPLQFWTLDLFNSAFQLSLSQGVSVHFSDPECEITVLIPHLNFFDHDLQGV